MVMVKIFLIRWFYEKGYYNYIKCFHFTCCSNRSFQITPSDTLFCLRPICVREFHAANHGQIRRTVSNNGKLCYIQDSRQHPTGLSPTMIRFGMTFSLKTVLLWRSNCAGAMKADSFKTAFSESRGISSRFLSFWSWSWYRWGFDGLMNKTAAVCGCIPGIFAL